MSSGTTPGEGRNPTTPQNAAGLRRLPPVSEPIAIGHMPVASATAEPPEEPAQLLVRSCGLAVAPYTALRVFAPALHSGLLVLPSAMAPAARRVATMASSLTGRLSRKISEPNVVGRPATSNISLMPSGRPCSGPRLSPAMTLVSAARASSSMRPKSKATSALTAGFTASTRAMQLSASSTGESLRREMSWRASMAVKSAGVVNGSLLQEAGPRSCCNTRALPTIVASRLGSPQASPPPGDANHSAFGFCASHHFLKSLNSRSRSGLAIVLELFWP